MKKFLALFVVSTGILFGAAANAELAHEPLFDSDFREKMTSIGVARFVEAFQTVRTPHEFEVKILGSVTEKDKRFIRKTLSTASRLPSVQLKNGAMVIQADDKTFTVKLKDAASGEMTINGKKWKFDFDQSYESQFSSLVKIMESSTHAWIPEIIPVAQANPAFVPAAAAVVVTLPFVALSMGNGLGCVSGQAIRAASSEEAWAEIKKRCPKEAKEPFLMEWRILKGIYSGVKNITGLNSQGKHDPDREEEERYYQTAQ